MACNDSLGYGDGCKNARVTHVDGCSDFSKEHGMCFGCVEGLFTEFDVCVPCGDSRRCLDASKDLLCSDGAALVDGRCTTAVPVDTLLATHNRVVKCSDGHFANDGACIDCTPHCQTYRAISKTPGEEPMLSSQSHSRILDGASSSSTAAPGVSVGSTEGLASMTLVCGACVNASLESDGTCRTTQNAVAQTHKNVVSCTDDNTAMNETCVPCASLFGEMCTRCSATECLACRDAVLVDGICRNGMLCQTTNGTRCT